MKGDPIPQTVDELDYHLPDNLIAQEPLADRAASRLLHYCRFKRSIVHRTFRDLPGLVRPGDVMVFNDARVTPARFVLTKPTGGRVEALFVEQTNETAWWVMLRNLGALDPQMSLRFERDPDRVCRVARRIDAGLCEVEFGVPTHAGEVLDRIGRMPLPPYIKRDKSADERDDSDQARYQTVYASQPGAIAAPTAGLHFTDDVLRSLDAAGVIRATVTLYVGLGTFKPIEANVLDDHRMHVERYTLPADTCEKINKAKRQGGRVIAVGTTTTRVLESQAPGMLEPITGTTDLFIRPPWTWRHVNGLVTNFHQPRSTLIALVAGWVGLSEQRRIYNDAIREGYRFLSYGDSMFVE
jgi:S-adenosylmethionine:tRNA ribosyltransferase-isomerase